MDQQLREAEHRRDARSWATWILRLGDQQIVDLHRTIKEQIKWLQKQELILKEAIPRCYCGEGATHNGTCEAHQTSLQEYRDFKEVFLKNPGNRELAATLMRKANNCGHPDRVPDRCFFPHCQQYQEYDYDMALAFCLHHEEFLRSTDLGGGVHANRQSPRKTVDDLSKYLYF